MGVLKTTRSPCSGFSYNFSIDTNYNKNNDIKLVIENNHLVFVTDKISIKFIQSSTVDWTEDLSSAQFIVENPQAKEKCGCGTSFSI